MMEPAYENVKICGALISRDYEGKTMNELPPREMHKLLEFHIPIAEYEYELTDEDIVQAVREQDGGCFDDMSDGELLSMLNSWWTDICDDGIVLWGMTRPLTNPLRKKEEEIG